MGGLITVYAQILRISRFSFTITLVVLMYFIEPLYFYENIHAKVTPFDFRLK